VALINSALTFNVLLQDDGERAKKGFFESAPGGWVSLDNESHQCGYALKDVLIKSRVTGVRRNDPQDRDKATQESLVSRSEALPGS
jgi:hypothetical protein